MNTLLKSATIIDPSSAYHQQTKDILIIDGKIAQIAAHIPSEKEYAVVSKDNLHVSTGWFDTSVSFGEPGFEERETNQKRTSGGCKKWLYSCRSEPQYQPDH